MQPREDGSGQELVWSRGRGQSLLLWPALGAAVAGGLGGRREELALVSSPSILLWRLRLHIFPVKSLKPEIRMGARSHGSSLDSPAGELFLLPGTQGHNHFFPVIQLEYIGDTRIQEAAQAAR